jgi:hypothetical protein
MTIETNPTANESASFDVESVVSDLNLMPRLGCAWSGVVATILFAIGFIPCAHFLPFPSPALSAPEVVQMISDNKIGIRVGVIFMIIGFGLISLFFVSVALELNRSDGKRPVHTYAQLVCAGASAAILALGPLFFALMAYRPAEISADVTQTLYDLAWFTFVMPYPVFAILLVAQGLAILRDKKTPPVCPRWAAYLCFSTALGLIPTGFVIFFKDGPLAWNGIIGLGIPMIVFFSWIMVLSFYLVRHVRREIHAAS